MSVSSRASSAVVAAKRTIPARPAASERSHPLKRYWSSTKGVGMDRPVDDSLTELQRIRITRHLVVLHQRLHQDHRRHVGERLCDVEAGVEEPHLTLHATEAMKRPEQSAHVVQQALVLAFEEPGHQREQHTTLFHRITLVSSLHVSANPRWAKPSRLKKEAQGELPLTDLDLLAAQVTREAARRDASGQRVGSGFGPVPKRAGETGGAQAERPPTYAM